jgi:RNA polymerase sigma factor (sigma-70 family)
MREPHTDDPSLQAGDPPLDEPDDRVRFSVEESDAIAEQAARGRALDRRLTEDLQQPGATTRAASGAYIQALGRRGRLPANVERELVGAAVAGDRDARAALVEAFLPLIGSVARNYRASQRVSRLELMQEGVAGLLRALERFDPDSPVPFWAYASWWVRQAMQQLVSELGRPVVLSDRALRQLSRVKDAHADHQRETGCEATLPELAQRSGVDEQQLANLIAADRPARGLEQPLHGEEGAVGTFGELIADPLAEDEYEQVITRIAASQVRDLLSGLSDRERMVLGAHLGVDGPAQSLREIAERLGVSAERVRQLEERALGKLRAAASGEPYAAE